MNEGFILLHRRIIDSWLSQRSDHFHWFIILLLKANFKGIKDYLFNGNFIEIKRGQFITSINVLAKELPNCSDKKARNFLNLLSKSEIIKTENLKKGTRITICNYDYYQGDGQDRGKVGARLGRDVGKTGATIEIKKKKDNKENNYKTTLLSNLTKSDFIDSKYFDVTMSFYEVFKKNLLEAGASISTLEKAKGSWIDHIRLIYETDKQTSESVTKVFKHLQTAEFWKKNILSTSKLREKFNQLLIEIKSKENEANRPTKKTTGATPEQVAKILSKKFAQRRNSL